jgi:nicotinamide-nucleotide amidase
MKTRYDDEAMAALAAALAAELRAHGRRLATAESCTGGWIAKVCTDLAGSSDWFERGYVSYSNGSKQELLGVRPADLHRFGAVSEEVAAAMAAGARERAGVDYALSVSGVAGPGGGSPEKPVGTVCFGWALPDRDTETETLLFVGDRDDIRRQTVVHAIQGLLARLRGR